MATSGLVRALGFGLLLGLLLSQSGCVTWSVPSTTIAPPQTSGAGQQPVKPSQQQTPVVRGQSPSSTYGASALDDDNYSRQPMPTWGSPQPAAWQIPSAPPSGSAVVPAQYSQPPFNNNIDPGFAPGPSDMVGPQPLTGRFADLEINVRETQTGRFMFGVGVNSDAGLTGQIVLDEFNFDWKRFPRSVDDVMNGTAWRGGGQRLRIEAIPGTELQRYLVNFTEPYLFDSNVSLNLSGFLYDRRYFDWDEQRLGGRIGLGYRLTPDLSLSTGMRLENVNISDPRVNTVPELNEVLGDNSLYSGRLTLTHDTRDSPFAPTEGHFLEMTFEQVFGTYVYPRGNVDYRRDFLITERPDGSGRHVLGASLQSGLTGSDTPIYENFFAGGYSTIRGFRFRSVPQSERRVCGRRVQSAGLVGVHVPDHGRRHAQGRRVLRLRYGGGRTGHQHGGLPRALGAGLRISVPAMGPAPIALDFAVPVAREETDRIQNFSFFVGFGR